MCKETSVLIIDDHPFILEGLTNILYSLSDKNGKYNFNVSTAKDSDTALKEIKKSANNKPFDLVLLDISIPRSSDGKILSGEDLGLEIKCLFPKVKIVVLTMHNSNYRLHNILRELNPDGFILKTEMDSALITEALDIVLEEPPFYSKAILRLVRKHIAHNIFLDSIDRKILYHLNKGTLTKDIGDYVGLSQSAVEQRKSNLKTTFGIDKGNNRDLITKAEIAGFI